MRHRVEGWLAARDGRTDGRPCQPGGVLFRPADLEGIAGGRITLQFRRWERARVLPGTRLRTPIGVLEVDSVEVVERPTDEDARAAGYDDAEHVIASFAKRKGALHRIALHLAGPDPRIALRETPPDDAVFAQPGADGRLDLRGPAPRSPPTRACARPTSRRPSGARPPRSSATCASSRSSG